ncbi:hypothetical protein [Clostridium butyricum]|uniref:hypothetical protein n=2 Tax=Clostridium butyricum TaxID=1492 RepID=UPI0005C139D2|nr:hypothetical protein [Clostridium butyricum]KIU07781.1 hypothetical protein SC08_Contig83orf01703 [Clostridium butyricum]MBA8967612.1 hypothetical protein [Clostridium butyricum]MBA8971321.1 hypothetical protein [Clostridium butyricum]MBC2429383.1 hypothetical protein [Clostridium butyricum]NOW36813.1 hypothetical protein [Clostridium butyricum]
MRKKEALFNVYLKLNNILQKECNIKFREIELEKNIGKNRRVDIEGILIDNSRFYAEIQIDKSYSRHIQQIKDLISVSSNDERTIIAYISTDFREDEIKELMKYSIDLDKKNIELMFITINKEAVAILEEIDRYKNTEKVRALKKLERINKLFIEKQSLKLVDNNEVGDKATGLHEEYCLSYEEQILRSILTRLRKDCRDLSLNLHYHKEIDSRKFFIIGLGIDSLVLKVTSADKKGRIGIELIFNGIKNRILLKKFVDIKEKIDDQFNYILQWDLEHNKIGTYYHKNEFKKDNMLNRLCRDIKEYLIKFPSLIEEYSIEN